VAGALMFVNLRQFLKNKNGENNSSKD
jgi:hypothetical protein